MAREGVDQLGAVVGPHEDLVLVVAHAVEGRVAFQLRYVELNADLLPLLGDHLPDSRQRDERARGICGKRALSAIRQRGRPEEHEEGDHRHARRSGDRAFRQRGLSPRHGGRACFGVRRRVAAFKSADVSAHSKLQHVVPLALIFQHDLAKETNGRHAVVEQLVVKFLQ